MQTIQSKQETKNRILSKIDIQNQSLFWAAIIVSLVIYDLVVIGLALRAAFWIRFEIALPLF